MDNPEPARYRAMYPALLIYAGVLLISGLLLGDTRKLMPGLVRIVLTEDALITDYVLVSGLGAALVNSALVTLLSIAILYVSHSPCNGMTLVVIGLMSGFSLFGNNSWLSNRRRSDGTQGHSPPVRVPGPAADLSGSRRASGWQKAAWAQPAQPWPQPPFPARRFRTIRRMIAATIRSRTPATRI